MMSLKINNPEFERNKAAILEILQKHFDENIDGKVLEISSGTGQHVSYFARHFPRLIFQPSEYKTSFLSSIKAYADDTPTRNIQDPIIIDVQDHWTTWNVARNFDYALNVNMRCTTDLFVNISAILKPGGFLITRGALVPQFMDKYGAIGESMYSEYCLRYFISTASLYGIHLQQIYDLSADNKYLVWNKPA